MAYGSTNIFGRLTAADIGAATAAYVDGKLSGIETILDFINQGNQGTDCDIGAALDTINGEVI